MVSSLSLAPFTHQPVLGTCPLGCPGERLTEKNRSRLKSTPNSSLPCSPFRLPQLWQIERHRRPLCIFDNLLVSPLLVVATAATINSPQTQGERSPCDDGSAGEPRQVRASKALWLGASVATPTQNYYPRPKGPPRQPRRRPCACSSSRPDERQLQARSTQVRRLKRGQGASESRITPCHLRASSRVERASERGRTRTPRRQRDFSRSS